jgi:type IV fimbrial biogenesis protein FimT
MKHGIRKAAVGVTLIELLVTMSVLVILLTVGVPQLGFMVAHNTRSAEVNTLIGHLNFARSLAISRSLTICVCPVNLAAPTTCTDTAWSNGYAVLVQDGGAPLRLHEGSKAIDITDNNSGHQYCFKDDGSVGIGGTITFCDARDDAAADSNRADGVVDPVQLVVSPVGRVLLSTADDIDCSSPSP